MPSRGDVYLGTIGYTLSSAGSIKKSYPIKQKFVAQNNISWFPPGSNWTLHPSFSNVKYWYPYSTAGASISDNSYIVYNDGDELTFQEQKPKSTPELVLPSYTNQPQTGGRYQLDAVGISSFVYANEIYSITSEVFNWSDTGLPDNKNPYKTNVLNKWRKQSDTLQSNYTPYWYHPAQKRFYPVSKTIAAAQYGELYSMDRYSKFTGEAQELNLENFTKRRIEQLELQGLSKRAAIEVVAAEDAAAEKAESPTAAAKGPSTKKAGKTAKTTTTSGTNSSSATAQAESAQRDSGTRNRAVVATIKKSINSRILALGDNTKAEMVQYYRTSEGDYSLTPDRFQFRYYPNNVSYTDLGANWTEIDRVNNTPFVDFRNFKLMKISFEFVVGDNTNLMTSCDDELKMLRQMASRPESVIFLGMDKMFTEQLIYPSWTGGSGIEFAIVDLTINSVQRVQQPPDANSASSPRGEIARATCNLTIQELPLEGPNLIVLPRLTDISTPTIPTTTPGGTCVPLLWSNPGVTKNRDTNTCNNEQTGK